MSGLATRLSCLTRIVLALCCPLLLLFGGVLSAHGQESLLVAADYGTLSLVDLATLNTTQAINAGEYLGLAAVGANSRLAFVGAGGYISVIDFTLGREVTRIYGVCASGFSAFARDQRYLLVEDQCGDGFSNLAVIDTVSMRVIRKIALAPVFGFGAYTTQFGAPLGSIVVAGNKAFVTTQGGDGVHTTAAIVDLRTFKIRPINLPSGYLDFNGTWLPNAGLTADGKYVATVQTDNKPPYDQHLYLINAQTGQVEKDYPQNYPLHGLVVNPTRQSRQYAYLLVTGLYSYSASVMDLQTGEILSNTEVDLYTILRDFDSAAITSDGSKLIVAGQARQKSPPRRNIVVIDTALMLTNPGAAIIGTASVAGGVIPHGISVASATTTSPPTAPTVSSVVPSTITNDVANTITLTGTNFASGAVVRVGTNPPLPANVTSSTTLQVTVPPNAPAQATLDVVVTNPNLSGPPAQRYQSGLAAGALTIKPTPAFQPKYQFGAYNAADYSVSVYDRSQGTMLNVPNLILPLGITFNRDGAEIYAADDGQRGGYSLPGFSSYNPADGTLQMQASFSNSFFPAHPPSDITVAASINPKTGGPVVLIPARATVNGSRQDAVYMVDTDPNSLYFNSVIQILATNSDWPYVVGAVATPDGKYVYANAYATWPGRIFALDVIGQTSHSMDTEQLGVQFAQTEMAVSPDGKSLLLAGTSATYGLIMVFDIGADPMNPTLVTTITGMSPPRPGGAGPLQLSSWKMLGNRLYALDDKQGVLAVFNFDRVHSDFTQLAGYILPGYTNRNHLELTSGFSLTPDGSLIFVPYPTSDMVQVLDVNRLLNSQDPLVTNLGAFRQPTQVTVSPVAQSERPQSAR